MEVDVITSTEHDMLSVDNMPTPQVLSKYRLAGHFCSTAIKAVIEQCVPGANTTQLCQFGDEAILAQVPSGVVCVTDNRR
jgi:methionine aminopeptidase